jgi:hypothetical protein
MEAKDIKSILSIYRTKCHSQQGEVTAGENSDGTEEEKEPLLSPISPAGGLFWGKRA